MKKTILLVLLIVTGLCSYAQIYNNEWIDYSKAYYKFKIGATGLYRISQSSLSAAGLGSTAAQNFQLWHNGVEVAMYTSVSSGALSAFDYLEFYGEINDGKLDTKLYKNDTLQMSDKWSLYTDTSAYFLTVNTSSANKRLANTANNVAGNTLAAEPYFMYTLGKYYKTALNQGFGYDLGEVVHSASYETAEGWGSDNIGGGYSSTVDVNNNLHVYTSGPLASFDVDIAGNTANNRTASVTLNGAALTSGIINSYGIGRWHVGNIAISQFTGDAANIQFSNSGTSADNIIVADYRITYPRQFDFGGQSQFCFQMPASDTGNYLAISNFNSGSGTPVLYDLSNNLRLTGIVISGVVQFALPPSAVSRKLVLLSTDAGVVNSVTGFTQRNFVNYSNAANQGDYLIISNTQLFNDGSGNNNVENYRLYRSSSAGGSYNAKIIDIDQLIDQFAFGVKHHPASVRNFAAYALANFSVQPKFFFLIGKGLNYEELRTYESDPNESKLALVPTFGWPASDNLLTATRTGEYATIPLGRLSAVSGGEIANYLNKVKEFELAQVTDSQTIGGKAWMKNMAQLTGGLSDPSLASLIGSYMQGYEAIASDTLFGAKVYQFSQNSGLNTAAGTDETLPDLFAKGMSLLTYFGHSSPNSIEFSLNDPKNYNNTGKYPAIIINGCDAGDLFEFDTLRAISGGSLSERFTFADKKGSIAFISSSHFGLPTELDYITSEFYRNLCNKMYGQPLGAIMQTTMQHVIGIYFSDYIAQTHVEEINLHGDPAVRLNPQSLPDYTTQDSLVSFDPSTVSVADSKVTITVRMLNIGKATGDSLPVLIQHQFPDKSVETLFSGKIKPLTNTDSIVLQMNIDPLKDTGLNHLTISLDPNNIITESSEINNTVTRDFTILEDELRPVWPYNYAVTGDPNVSLYASTADPLAAKKQYVMQIDTTALFNSPLKTTKTVTDSGGIIKFAPGLTLHDSTVYYWRVGVGPANAGTHWLSSSFVFINGSDEGFNQSHYFQYKDNTYTNMQLDSNTRKVGFADKTRDLLIRTGLYPYYGWDQIDVNIDANKVELYGCVYGSLQIVVYDSLTLKPWINSNSNGFGRFGSAPVCAPTKLFFEFPAYDSSYRRKAMQFLDSIPSGDYVSISNLGWIYNTTFIDQWKADTARLGSGNSLWHKFQQLGLDHIDSFTTNLPFLFVFKKGDAASFPISQSIGPAVNSQIVNSYDIPGKQIDGTVESPWFGPMKSWKHFKWDELASDSAQSTYKQFDIIGMDANNNEYTLATVYNSKDTDISFIDASVYPKLKIVMTNDDPQHAQATQLKYWMLTGDKVPEGGISPNIFFQTQDTLGLYDTLHVRAAFKNVSNVPFDSIAVKFTITDVNGVTHSYNNLSNGFKLKSLSAGDTVIVYYDIPVTSYPGQNKFTLEVNPDNGQPEQFHFNNLLYRPFFVRNEICPGSSTSFSVGSTIPGYTYKWQVDSGTGYADILPDSVYSGETSSTLVLNVPPGSLYGYKYHCIVTDDNLVSSNSSAFVLKFSNEWLGTVDSSWENPANWSCGALPDGSTDVIIKQGLSVYPVINVGAVCRSISAAPNTSVTVAAGANLDIKGKPAN